MTEHRFGGRTLRVLYPDALRPLTPDELEDLRGSIRDRGIMVPVLVDEDDGLIDDGHRCRIAEDLGLTDIPIRVIYGLTEDQKRALAVEINDCRRNQSADELQARRRTRAEKRAVVAAALINTPEQSDRAIAVRVEEEMGEKIDHKTVGRVREQLGSSEQIPQLPKSKGRDGKTYPSRRKRKPDHRGKTRPTRHQIAKVPDDSAAGNETPVDMLGRPLPPHLVPVFGEHRRFERVQCAYAELVGSLRSLRGSGHLPRLAGWDLLMDVFDGTQDYVMAGMPYCVCPRCGDARREHCDLCRVGRRGWLTRNEYLGLRDKDRDLCTQYAPDSWEPPEGYEPKLNMRFRVAPVRTPGANYDAMGRDIPRLLRDPFGEESVDVMASLLMVLADQVDRVANNVTTLRRSVYHGEDLPDRLKRAAADVASLRAGHVCDACDGSGKVRDDVCYACGGDGTFPWHETQDLIFRRRVGK